MLNPVDDMIARWQMAPRHRLDPDLVPGGVSAALFTNDDPAERQVSGYLPDHWVLAWHVHGLEHGVARINGRVPYDGQVLSGTWVMVPPGDRPHATVYGAWEVLHLYIPKVLLAGANTAMKHAGGVLFGDRIVSSLLTRFYTELALTDRPSKIATEGLGLQITGALMRLPVLGPGSRSGLGTVALNRALRMIESDPLADVAALAAATGLSRPQFTRLFRAATGQSPGKALGQARLDRALAMIARTDTPMTQIALEAGYADSAHLARDVRARIGMSPTEYRRNQNARRS